MKNLIYTFANIALTIFLCSTPIIGQNFSWAKSFGGNQIDYSNAVTVDTVGNVSICGYSSSSIITFGPDTLGDLSTVNKFFLAQYDGYGNEKWFKLGASNSSAQAVATDNSGNTYLAGTFNGSTLPFDTTVLSNPSYGNNSQVYLAKYNNSGKVLWAKTCLGRNFCSSLAVDAFGYIYLAGYFYSSITFGATTLNSSGYADVFLAKLDANGDVAWAKSISGTGSDQGLSVAIDNLNNIYIAGTSNSPSLTIDQNTLQLSGSQNVFITKYGSDGKPIWTKTGSGAQCFGGHAITTDKNGNIFFVGKFSNQATFNSVTLSTSTGNGNYIVKYSTSGELLLAKGYSDNTYYYDAALDTSGNIFISGFYYGNSICGLPTSLGANSATNFFVAKLAKDANVSWVYPSSTNFNSVGYSIVTDGNGNAYASGSYSSQMNMGAVTLGKPINTAAFVTKILSANTSDVKVSAANPGSYSLIQNYPNPFNPETTIQYSIPTAEHVTLKVFNELGQEVKTLVDEERSAGTYKVNFSGRDLSSGVYIYRMSTNSFTQTRKLILLK